MLCRLCGEWSWIACLTVLRSLILLGTSYFDGLRNFNSAANLIQAQRDYFGAHTYERTDAERGKFFHTDWTGKGGKTVSGTYNV